MAEFEKIDERESQIISNKAKFVLTSFGLDRLKVSFYPPQFQPTDQKLGSSQFNTPIFTNLEFPAGSYEPLDGGATIEYGPLVLDTILMDVTQSKNIVKTVLQGRNGTVKEYTSNGDYQINIKGAIVSQDANKYPEDDVNTLVDILNVPSTLEVISDYLDLFGIDEVVVENYSLPQREGFRNMQLFNVRLIQNEPIILRT